MIVGCVFATMRVVKYRPQARESIIDVSGIFSLRGLQMRADVLQTKRERTEKEEGQKEKVYR